MVWLFGESFWTALLVGVGLTQIGEFSFVLVQVARNAGHVGPEIYNATLAASLVTILINAVLVRTVPGWIARYRGVEERAAPTGRGAGGGGARRALRLRPRRQRGGRGARDLRHPLRRHRAGSGHRPGPSLARGAVPVRRRRAAAPSRGGRARHGPSLVVVALPEIDRAQLAVRGVRALEPAGADPGARAQRLGPRRAAPTRAPPRSSSPSWKRRPR